MIKDTFILYTSYKDAIMVLSDAQAGQLLKAIFEYATTGVKQDINDTAVKFAYMLIVSQIESCNQQYKQKCERNRENAAKRWQANASNGIQAHQSKTEKCDGMRTDANGCDGMRTDAYRYDMIDMIDMNKEEKEDKKKSEPSSCVDTHSSSSSEFSEIVEYWNAAVEKSGSVMNKLQRMTDRRMSAVRARVREHKPEGLEAVKRMIDKAVVSDFLNGRNSRNAIFTFDRLMAPEMFQKTLEGNYDNKPKDEQQPQAEQSSIGRLMQEQAQQHEDRNKEQRQRYEGMIAIVERNPQHRCREALVMAYKNGTLKSLGIEWKPE